MQKQTNVNVGDSERLLSGLLGGAFLILAAQQKKSWLVAPTALFGLSMMGRGVTGKCQVYRELGIDSRQGHHLAIPGGMFNGTVKVQKTVTIKGSPAQIYQFWRKFDNLPKFMQNLESVCETSPGHTHWLARGPGDVQLEWDAHIHEDTSNERISWATDDHSPIQHNGSVSFREDPAGRGTQVKVVLRYDIPGGKLGQGLAKLLGSEPGQQLDADLRRLKMFLETGEVARTDGQSAGANRDTSGQMSTNDAVLDLSIF